MPEIWVVNRAVLLAVLLRPNGSRGPKPPAAEGRTASFAANLYPKPRRLRPAQAIRLNLLAVLLRLTEPRSSPPPHAADCNSSELVALTAGGELLSCSERMGRAPATQRVARAGRLPTGGPQHAAPRRKLRLLSGVRPPKVKPK